LGIRGRDQEKAENPYHSPGFFLFSWLILPSDFRPSSYYTLRSEFFNFHDVTGHRTAGMSAGHAVTAPRIEVFSDESKLKNSNVQNSDRVLKIEGSHFRFQ
jgi:hypothetical protein